MSNIIEQFKNREVKAKDTFDIYEISKDQAYDFVRQYHYLGNAKFFAMYSYGLFLKGTNVLVGCATYSLPQGTCALKGWFGIEDNNSKDVMELSRLCMLPMLNGSNATSYLLGNSMKMLKNHNVRAIITLADASRHIGSIYQVCNFKYFGLAKTAKDFWRDDGQVNPRGETGSMRGVYLPRNRKHRYAFILDKKLTCLYNEEPHPTIKGETISNECCDDSLVVYDNRYNEYFTCPKCSSMMIRITKEEYNTAKHFNDFDKAKEYIENIIHQYKDTNKIFDKESLW